jgi:ribosomal protein S18 acetylase RimI-like enzyme
MIAHLLECARQQQLQYVSLEVIDKNVGALDLYQQFGFETQRRLVMMDRPQNKVDSTFTDGLLVVECEAHEALVFYNKFHEVQNAWQRSHYALVDLSDNLRGWLIVENDCPDHVLGYVVGWITDRDIHILDLAGDPTEDRQALILQRLVQHLHNDEPNAIGHAFNVGDNDVMYMVLRSLDYEEILVQYEMVLPL